MKFELELHEEDLRQLFQQSALKLVEKHITDYAHSYKIESIIKQAIEPIVKERITDIAESLIKEQEELKARVREQMVKTLNSKVRSLEATLSKV